VAPLSKNQEFLNVISSGALRDETQGGTMLLQLLIKEKTFPHFFICLRNINLFFVISSTEKNPHYVDYCDTNFVLTERLSMLLCSHYTTSCRAETEVQRLTF